MKTTILTVIGIILILLASVAVISYESDSYNLKKFVIGGNKESKPYNIKSSNSDMRTFVIGQKQTGKDQLIGLKKDSKCARERNQLYQQREEEIEKCITHITKNWKRTYGTISYEKVYDQGNLIEENQFWEKKKEFYGFDEDKDAGLRFKLRNKALNGEKIC